MLYSYDSFDNTGDFYIKVLGNVNTLTSLLSLGSPVPSNPTIVKVVSGDSTEYRVFAGATFFSSNSTYLWYSTDSAYTFSSVRMAQHYALPLSYFRVKLPNTGRFIASNLIYYAESKGQPFFYLSTRPFVPEGLLFKIRPFPYEFFLLGDKTDLPDMVSLDVRIIPNPFNGSLLIESEKPFCFSVFDINGKMVENFPNNSKSHLWSPTFDISSGMYFLRIDTGNDYSVKKVLYVR